jgi:hypothetical protein
MNLIANSGVQLIASQFQIDNNDSHKMFFQEWLDIGIQELNLQLTHYFSEEGIWVKKRDLFELGYIHLKDIEENGKFYKKGSIKGSWEEIKDDFLNEGKEILLSENSTEDNSGCFKIGVNNLRIDKFENVWLPVPLFYLNNSGRSAFGPTNWCRVKFELASVAGGVRKYNVVFAIDTRTNYEDIGFEDHNLKETPVFTDQYENYKDFGMCRDEFMLMSYVSKISGCDWVDDYLLQRFHGVKDLEDIKIASPKLGYLAQYLFLMSLLERSETLSKIRLFSDRNEAHGGVDLVVDIGNSRTCAVLFDNSDFTRVEQLSLQNFTNVIHENELNVERGSFDMRLGFKDVDFGGKLIVGSKQFVFPSYVRLGHEAEELINKTTNLNLGLDKYTTFSSPKRFLWDSIAQDREWEFISLNNEEGKVIWIDGVSEQINPDGTINFENKGGVRATYSKRALMTFCFLEILAQARMQINSYSFRNRWGSEGTPRRINRIIVTCPTAMSGIEQHALRKCAEDASIILERFYGNKISLEFSESNWRKEIKVIPSSHNLRPNGDVKTWIYDEATCAQFVYLYAEINQKYQNNCQEFFDFFGKLRPEVSNSSKNSLTVGSVDIGAGTTDVMIANYNFEETEASDCVLKPIPLFWESFYQAGDDLLKELIRHIVISGENGKISNTLKTKGNQNVVQLINDFFGKDNARMSVKDRQIRREFNLQVSIPVVTRYLELLGENKIDSCVLGFKDIFRLNPTQRVLQHFSDHFGFSIEEVDWKFNKEYISKVVEKTFDPLIAKISAVLSFYDCDIVLLSGRPTSLKPLTDLFLKYYAINPNRLITLDDYRVGNWYPFQDGKGFFRDAKSIVAVGAMIGNFASTRGGLNGFTLNLDELASKMSPTTNYFSTTEQGVAMITPELGTADYIVSQFPNKLWTRQLNSLQYPTRPFYKIGFNKFKIREMFINKQNLDFVVNSNKKLIHDAIEREIENLQKLAPYKIKLTRINFTEDREKLEIESILDRNNNEVQLQKFSLQVQSMSEDEEFWLDSGEFQNINIV